MGMFIAAWFIISQNQKQFNVSQLVNGCTGCGTFAQWNTPHQYKGVNNWYLQPRGWVSKAWCWVKATRNQRLHTACSLYFYDVCGEVEQKDINRLAVAWAGRRWRDQLQRSRGEFARGDRTVVCDHGGPHGMAYICQNSLKHTSKIGKFYCVWIIPQ